MPVRIVGNRLIGGDPLDPQSTDLILQEGCLPVGERVPPNWRVMTGNNFDSQVFRIAYRYEIADLA